MSTQDIDNPKTLEDWKASISIYVHSKGKGRLNEYHINEIATLYEDINLLKEHGINTNNYHTKVGEYYKFCEKALIEYGIELNAVYPFKKPTNLYLKIHKILLNAMLNERQIKVFYKISSIRSKKPKSDAVDKYMKKASSYIKVNKSNLISEVEFCEQQEEWDKLSTKEQLEIIGITDEEYKEELQRQEEISKYNQEYNLKKEQLKKKFMRIQHKKLSS